MLTHHAHACFCSHALQSPVFRDLRAAKPMPSDLDTNTLVLPHTRMYSFLHFALTNVKDDVFDSCVHLWLAYNRPWYRAHCAIVSFWGTVPVGL